MLLSASANAIKVAYHFKPLSASANAIEVANHFKPRAITNISNTKKIT
jgi:hypothetical protein